MIKAERGYLWPLTGILLLGAILRFAHLTLKPLWLDEVITALFSLGQGYEPVPQGTILPLAFLDRLFTLQPATTCAQVVDLVTVQSVHPPLFFCGMHLWLKAVAPLDLPLIWSLRALPAVFGVAAIAAVYALNRVAFSPEAGLMAAALMAVSPFAVYLSQEARHYTLPMLLLTLALLGLVHIQRDLQRQRQRLWLWLGWLGINSLGFYVHYFFLLAVIAQGISLWGWMLKQRSRLQPRQWMIAALAIAALGLSYLPWLPTLLAHMARPETDWLALPASGWLRYLAPLFQTLAGWVVMVVALPTENQPLWIAIPMGLLMFGFLGWLSWLSYRGAQSLGRNPQTQSATGILLGFLLCVLLEFLAIVYGLGKDITIAPRYNFVYYPAVCALLGASLVNLPGRLPKGWRHLQQLVLLFGACSCVLVITNLAFLKPFMPERVAQDLLQASSGPLTVLMATENTQDIALGLSLVLAVNIQASQSPERIHWGFIPPPKAGIPVSLPRQSAPVTPDLWLINPRQELAEFPTQFSLAGQQEWTCITEPGQASPLGVLHQHYRCAEAQ